MAWAELDRPFGALRALLLINTDLGRYADARFRIFIADSCRERGYAMCYTPTGFRRSHTVARPLLPRIAPLRFHPETCGPFCGPEYGGALFGGGSARFFRDLACLARKPVCGGFGQLDSCPSSVAFETPAIPGQFTVLRKYRHAPHPFVVVRWLDAAGVLASGQVLRLDVTLIGPGVD